MTTALRILTRPVRTSPRLGLLWTLIRTDFKVRYYGTAAGFLWALLKPIVMAAVLLSVFSILFGHQPGYRWKLVVGLFLWDFFVESTRVGVTSIYLKGYLLTKVRFPAWAAVVTSGVNALTTLSVFLFTATVALSVFVRPVSPLQIALVALYVVLFSLITLGLSLASSVLFVRYRDINQIWEVATNAGFFIAPVVYPIDLVPHRFQGLLYLWPPTPVISFVQSVLVDGSVPSLRAHLALVAMAVTILVAGAAVFRRYGPRVAEYV